MCESVKPILTQEQISKLDINQDLNPSQREQLIDLLAKFKDSISWSKYDLGQTDIIEHKIDTGTHSPIRSQPYKQPVPLQQVTNELVNEMLKNDIIEESFSPWSSYSLK